MNSTTTGKDILNAMLECTNDMDIDLKKTVSVTTDRVPAMIVKNKGFVTLFQNHFLSLEHSGNLLKFHCVIQ